jgi:radical SAM superfamily enzyme YgiQ (UPF0313 family)
VRPLSRARAERQRVLREAEVHLIPPRRHGALRVALAYPSPYAVGMSNLGFQAVYRLLLGEAEVGVERAFLPERGSGEDLGRGRQPLASFDLGTPLRDFDVLAFSVSFENDYLNVLRMLHLSGIPLRTTERTAAHPLVVFGGPATFLNPEPLAPFADVMAVGEGEVLVPRLVAALLGSSDRGRAIEALQEREGFYVPGRHQVRYHADGTIAAYDGPGPVVRQRAQPPQMPLPESAILTPHTEMSMKHLVEISRGCPCMCRFCWAGYGYLPVRAFSRSEVVESARAARAHTDRIGLVSTAVCAHPEIDGILDDLATMGFRVSVSSLRLDDLAPAFVSKLAETGAHGLTLAPECGSDRMRRVINKRFTNDEVLERAALAFERGIRDLRLYFMVGLPFEEESDVEAIVTLTAGIRERMVEARRRRGSVGRLQPSINPFVPKPGTPFQWLSAEDPRATGRKLDALRRAFAVMPNVDAICKSTRAGAVQSLLALGDRRLAPALEMAAVEGVDLRRAMEVAGLDPRFYLFRERSADERLPWDVVSNGVSRSYLLGELARSRAEAFSPHCPEAPGCVRCGVCSDRSGHGATRCQENPSIPPTPTLSKP